MRIIDRLQSGVPLVSFEFFPPRSAEAEAALWAALRDLRDLNPDFVSMTYGAGGSTRHLTLEFTARIKAEVGIEAMAHLTCVGSTREEIASVLTELAKRGVENVLLLRGDPPKGEKEFRRTEGGFGYASELVEFARSSRVPLCLGGACYPEVHVEASSSQADLDHLKRKVDAGAEFLISQLFFDNRAYFDFVDRARRAGIAVPIIPGIMPITNVDQVQRFTKLCGAKIPPSLLQELERRRDQPDRVLKLGVSYATIQSLGLLQGGAPGIHFYTLNRSTAAREIVSAMRMHGRL